DTYDVTVKYLGDDKYDVSENTTQEVFVNKVESFDFAVIVSDAKVGENTTVTVIVPGDADGNITIGDKTAKVENGQTVIVLDKEQHAGAKDVTVTYGNDSKYNDAVKVNEYVVDKANSNVSISVESIYTIGDTVTIILTPVNGTVDVKINDVTYTVVDNQVTFTANVTGNYEVVASVGESEDYYGSSATAVFDIVKASSGITIDVEDVYKVGEDIVITLTPTNSTGAITVTINGKPYTVTDNKVTIADGLAEGVYTVVANLASDSNYEDSYDSKVFDVIKNDIAVELEDVSNIEVGSPVTFTANLNETVTGNVIFNINGANYTVYISNADVASYTYIPANNDTLSVVATFVGNDKFNANSTEMSAEVSKVNDYELGVGVTVDDGIAILNIAVPDDATGKVNITVDGKLNEVPINDGKVVLVLNNLSASEHIVDIAYESEKYAYKTNNTKFIVNKSSEVNMGVEIIDDQINITLPENATGNVTVVIDDNVYNVTNISEVSTIIELNDIAPGNHTVEVIYSGDANYANKTVITSYEVPKVSDYSMILTSDNITCDQTEVITIELPDDVNGIVLIDLDGIGYYINVTNGVGSLELPNNLAPGEYNVTATYQGNDKYASKSAYDSFKVDISENIMDIEVKDGKIIVELSNDATGNVTITVAGKDYIVLIESGKAILDIPDLKPGDYDAIANYPGDIKYDSASNSTSFNIPKVSDYPMSVVLDDNKLVVTVPDDATGNVTIGDVSVPVADGKAVLDVSDLAPGNYHIPVVYSGDDKYDASNTNVNVVIPNVDPEMYAVANGSSVTVTLPEDASGYVSVCNKNVVVRDGRE
ncbi:MAG: Ig-like domain repeat protein, partial [Methanobrevibacter sp.]|nr:Ig-like domain repeat protein [Methanobrevibacter sp.]